jgi:hypothetical protein
MVPSLVQAVRDAGLLIGAINNGTRLDGDMAMDAILYDGVLGFQDHAGRAW